MNHQQVFRNIGMWMAVVLLCVAFSVSAQNTLSLDVGGATYKIEKEIYGGLMEDWYKDIYGGVYVGTASSIPNTRGMRNDVIAGLKEAKIAVLQFPGGCKSEQYTWTDVLNAADSLHTDKYFYLCSLVNASPFIQANYKDGTAQARGQVMNAWLDYINGRWPGRLKYLGIGNEPWGGCYTGVSVSTYMDRYDIMVDSIPAAFSGKLIRIFAAGSYEDMAWHRTAIQRALGQAEAMSWHYYTIVSWTDGSRLASNSSTDAQYYQMLTLANTGRTYFLRTLDTLDKYDPSGTINFQPDEWGAWYNTLYENGCTSTGNCFSYQQSTVRDAQICAFHLNLFNNYARRVKMAQAAQPCNAIFSFFITRINPPTTELIKTPVFYVYKLFSVHQGATMIPVTLTCGTVNSMPVINTSASIDSNKVIHISLSNIHATTAQTVTVTLANTSNTYSSASGQIVNGSSVGTINTFTTENVNIQTFTNFTLNHPTLSVTLPAHSVVMMTLTPTVGVTKEAALLRQEDFSIKSASGGSIVVSYSAAARTPVTLSLYGVDGKTVVESFNGTFEPGQKSLVWQPKNRSRSMGTKVYIIKVEAGHTVKTQRIALAH
jgi:alpha-N-arabinofuranosidase